MSHDGDAAFLLSIFLMEGWETVATVEAALDDLAVPVTAEAIAPLAIVAHRLKGAAALHGLPGVSSLGAEMEQILEAAPWTSADEHRRAVARLGVLVSSLKHALEVITSSGREPVVEAPPPRGRGEGEPLTTRISLGAPAEDRVSVSPAATDGAPATTSAAPDGSFGPPTDRTEHAESVAEVQRFLAENPDIAEFFGVEATEHLDTMTRALLILERDGARPDEIAALFRAAHTLKGAAYTVGCRAIGDLVHRVEDQLVVVRAGRAAMSPALIQELFEAVDAVRLMLGIAGSTEAAALASSVSVPAAARTAEPAPIRPTIRVSLERLDSLMNLVGELVISRSRLDRRLVELERLGQQHSFNRLRLTETVRDFENKYLDPTLSRGAPRGDSPPAPVRPARPGSIEEIFDELEFDRYDDFNILARRLGEISADVAELHAQLASLLRAVREDASKIQRLTGELRGDVSRARMVPIGGLFRRVARQVREAARNAGKSIALEISGESVELDNAIIDQIADPLLHLIQNAIAHGVEASDVRRSRGKPAEGTVRLDASLQGGLIVLTVEDDGAGIDVNVVKAQAVSRGYLGRAAAAAMADREGLDLIFLPGFSTAAEVTTAAGRGVGLDVVHTNIRSLNGEITVDTQVGRGTRFTITVPIALVVSDALMVRAGGETFAIALGAVKSTAQVSSDSGGAGDGTVRLGGETFEVIRLDRALGLPPQTLDRPRPVLLLRAGGKPVALAVDEVLGKEEIVIKPLGAFLEGVGPFGGGTISGDGRVILLLDPARLLTARAAAGAGPRRPSAPRVALESPCRVLVVDDSISVRKVVASMLERGGFSVLTASDGVEALEILGSVPVSAIITDLEMPRLNGYELIQDLRRRPSLRDVPVVVMTTRAGERHVSVAEQLGVKHYVTKPVDEKTFVRLLASIAKSLDEAEIAEAEVGEAAAR
jgi:chemosensory pili system protein ChpA (sensor histidine kinase/response regulator)